MLVLTAKEQEPVHLTDEHSNTEIQVVVLGVHGKQVKLGIQAPNNIKILRDKLKRKDAIRRGVFHEL